MLLHSSRPITSGMRSGSKHCRRCCTGGRGYRSSLVGATGGLCGGAATHGGRRVLAATTLMTSHWLPQRLTSGERHTGDAGVAVRCPVGVNWPITSWYEMQAASEGQVAVMGPSPRICAMRSAMLEPTCGTAASDLVDCACRRAWRGVLPYGGGAASDFRCGNQKKFTAGTITQRRGYLASRTPGAKRSETPRRHAQLCVTER